ncbi:MAG: hypothetical protein RLY14_3269 [Planctomycetota bacterium]|jgi:hypothetical protein
MKNIAISIIGILWLSLSFVALVHAKPPRVEESDTEIVIETDMLSAKIAKRGYVSGIKAQSFIDKKSSAHDLGFGLDIADWIMEPGSDEAYRDQLPDEMVYRFGNEYHGSKAKRSIEGPQICTQAKELQPEIIQGEGFVAIKQSYRYHTAAPGKKTGSLWTQLMVFPQGKRYYLSMQKIDAVNSSDAMFLRVDMPGHIKHQQGDSFKEVFLSYQGRIPATEFLTNFAPDQKFNYTRSDDKIPSRIIRAYRISEKGGAQQDVWLAGMTLDPSIVSEAWCHQRGYICMIEEFGGRPIKAGESFSAAFVVGYFDSIEEMEKVYDTYRGNNRLEVDAAGWRLKP